jgi:hypothetical protein
MLKSFSSPLDSDRIVSKLKSLVDEEVFDESHPDRYGGDRPLIGRVERDRFRIHRRVGRSWIFSLCSPENWFKPFVHGRVVNEPRGSQIRLEGSWLLLVKIIWVALIAGSAGLIAVVTIFSYPYTITHDPAHSGANLLIGFALLSVVTAVLIIIPVIGWFLSRNHLGEIENELRRELQLKEIWP